jgi:ring-1,2-phenylacetyl-CoA epoxidase subunit PaaD
VSSTLSPAIALADLRRVVEAVNDPELPVLTLGQLGVIRAVAPGAVTPAGPTALVDVTPTYSGCPAMEVIVADIAEVVRAAGWQAEVRVVLAPPWTTDWISDEGRTVLRDNGIAPPARRVDGPVPVRIGARPGPDGSPTCPQCESVDVEELARFGSTACKALWRCLRCREPFDYLKPL